MQTIEDARGDKKMSISQMCKALGIPRSFYYRRKKDKRLRKTEKEERVKEKINSIKDVYPYYGYRRVTKELERRGERINHKKVLSIMRENNLLCKRVKRRVKTTDSLDNNRIYNNIASKIELDDINKLWVSDITYIPFGSRYVYLSVVLDAYSRKCIGYALSATLEEDIVLRAMDMALCSREVKDVGLIHHSDRGRQYTSEKYIKLLERNGIGISMSRKGNPYDNAKCERFIGLFKEECLRYKRYNTAKELYNIVYDYINNIYNKSRLHSSLGYISVGRI